MTRVQHDERAEFVLQDQLCRLLIHMIRLKLISYIQVIKDMTQTCVLGTDIYFSLAKLICLIMVGNMVQESRIFRNTGGIFVTPGSGVYKYVPTL
jgi:hypothetical protein